MKKTGTISSRSNKLRHDLVTWPALGEPSGTICFNGGAKQNKTKPPKNMPCECGSYV